MLKFNLKVHFFSNGLHLSLCMHKGKGSDPKDQVLRRIFARGVKKKDEFSAQNEHIFPRNHIEVQAQKNFYCFRNRSKHLSLSNLIKTHLFTFKLKK